MQLTRVLGKDGLFALSLFLITPTTHAALGTAFTYQGNLVKNGSPVTDTCTFEFKLCDEAEAACAPGTVSNRPGIEVINGVFTVPDVDFGGSAFTGDARWLEIEVQCGVIPTFFLLAPRVELTPAPYALRASTGVGGPNGIHVNNVGNVGIGTTPGGPKLRVAGEISTDILSWGGTSALGDDQGGVIELGDSLGVGNNPYIDFHRGAGGAEDFNVRLINNAPQRLSLMGNMTVSGDVTADGDMRCDVLRWGTNAVNTSEGGAIELGDSSGINTKPFIDFHFGIGGAEDYSVRLQNDSSGQLSVLGNLHVIGNLTRAYSVGTADLAAPIAYATINSDGTVAAGTPNVTSVWNLANQRYEITITGESYSTTGYVTTVTPILDAAPEALFGATGAGSGQLRVRIMSSSTGTDGLQKPFQFVTFKPAE